MGLTDHKNPSSVMLLRCNSPSGDAAQAFANLNIGVLDTRARDSSHSSSVRVNRTVG